MKYELYTGLPFNLDFCDYERSYKKAVSFTRPPSFYAFEDPPSFLSIDSNSINLCFHEKDVIFGEEQDGIKVRIP